jgi:hypothetical protein
VNDFSADNLKIFRSISTRCISVRIRKSKHSDNPNKTHCNLFILNTIQKWEIDFVNHYPEAGVSL